MKQLVILGAGAAGTTIANQMTRLLPEGWKVVVVDPSETHVFQPGLLWLPFGSIDERRIVRPRGRTLHSGVEWRQEEVTEVAAHRNELTLSSGDTIPYDLLVVASGCRTRPHLTDGLLDDRWMHDIFDFYRIDGAIALRERLATFREGRLVVDVAATPIKSPMAPIEFLFLADAFFRDRGVRDRIELTFVTPLEGIFPTPVADEVLAGMLAERDIEVVTQFGLKEVDDGTGALVAADGRRVPFDLLVTVPVTAGAEFIERSGMGNGLGYVRADRYTLKAHGLDNVFVMGDAADVGTAKLASVAQFEGETVVENLLEVIEGNAPLACFDGHNSVFIETGHGQAMLVDYNFKVEALPGRFPFPGLGPFRLLGESRLNYWGKRALPWVYFNGLLPGNPVPIRAHMSLAGKDLRALKTDSPPDPAE